MNRESLVSVILPTYNRARTLANSIQSVLNQSHTNLELIIVDDGSSDDTPHVVAACGDPRIQYTAHTANRGAAAARNTGLRMAKGEFVAFQDSDDIWRQDKLGVQVGALKTSGAAICVCSHRLLAARTVSEVIRKEGEHKGESVMRTLMRGSHISTQTIVARTAAVKDAGGFDESLEVSEDYELCLRLAMKNDFVFVARKLVDINRSPDSISGDPRRFADATEHIVAKHADAFARDRRGYARQMLKAGKYFAYSDARKESLRYVVRAMKADPLNPKAVGLLIALATNTVPALRKKRP